MLKYFVINSVIIIINFISTKHFPIVRDKLIFVFLSLRDQMVNKMSYHKLYGSSLFVLYSVQSFCFAMGLKSHPV